MKLFSSFLCSNIFIGFPIILLWIFGFWIFEKTSDCLFMFTLRARKEQIISYEWLLFKSKPVNVNFSKSLCSRISWSTTLLLWGGTYFFWWYVKLLSEVDLFFQILKFEFGEFLSFQLLHCYHILDLAACHPIWFILLKI